MDRLKTAIVLGGTGLVGSELTQQLLNHESFGKVVLISRRPLKMNHPKLQVLLVDFNQLEEHALDIQADVLFSCLGTTIKKAKTKENQYLVDFTYQYDIAKIAAQNNIEHYLLVSAIGASPKSKVFYSRMKGELEESVKQLGFNQLTIVQPSILDGDRKEFRLGETIGLWVMKLLSPLPFLKRYRPIHAEKVAQKLIQFNEESKSGTFELN